MEYVNLNKAKKESGLSVNHIAFLADVAKIRCAIIGKTKYYNLQDLRANATDEIKIKRIEEKKVEEPKYDDTLV